MNLLHIADSAFTDQHWQSYYMLLKQLNDKYDSPVARIGWEQTKARLRSLVDSDSNYSRFVVFDGESPVGWSDLKVLSAGTPEQNAMVKIDAVHEVIPAEFERTVGTEILRLLDEQGTTGAHFMATTQRLSAMARHMFARELDHIDRFRLYRDRADTSRMRSWLEELPRANPELHLEFFSPVPEEHLAAYTSLFVTYIREMPTERESDNEFRWSVEETRRDIEWRQKNDVHLYTYALFNDDGVMVGHSNAALTGADPSDVYQAMTGISREYRGRGLSRWLKAALFFKVGEDFPANRYMTTDMRAANAPIQKVNSEMGYVLLSSGNEFELTAEGIRRFMGS